MDCVHQGHSHNGHAQSHDHNHDHSHDLSGQSTHRLLWVLVFTGLYLLAEAAGGWYANSLALLSDAGHMLTDVAALALAIGAMWLARRPLNPQRTYGYYRLEILAALVNGVALVLISGFIIFEAFERLQQPQPVKSGILILIATGGLLVNLVSIWVLHSSQQENLNVRGAFLHVVADALGSVAAVMAGLLIWAKGWYWIDPLLSIFVALLILWGAWQLVRDSVNILLESTPAHVNCAAVREALINMPSVKDVHDLHIWTIASGRDALSAHVIVGEGQAASNEMLKRMKETLCRDFAIRHTTIQLELPGLEEDEVHL